MGIQLPRVIQVHGFKGKTATVVAVIVLLLAAHSFGQHVQAQEFPDASPVGNCFGGTFTADPLHCHAFEQAYVAENLDIEAIYQGGGALFVYVTGSDPVEDDVYDYLNIKAQEEARRTGEHLCLLEERGCDLGVLYKLRRYTLPVSQSYENIFLLPGGEAALRLQTAWRAYRKLWPAEANGAGGASGASEAVDVSNVDTTNFPPLDCKTQAKALVAQGCFAWERNPGLGVAGFNRSSNSVAYWQVKVRPGQEETDVEAARATLQRRYPDYSDDDFVVIPVKYDYEDLWRWSLLLDRFTQSSGNTLGMTGAVLGENWATYHGDDYVFPVSDLPPAELGATADERTTIHIWTLELDRTVAALPQLLAQLNIPGDAVGVVARVDRTPPGRIRTEGDNGESEQRGAGTAGNAEAKTARWSNPVWLLAVAGIAALVVGLLAMRRLSRHTT